MVKNINKRYRKLEYAFVEKKPKANKTNLEIKKKQVESEQKYDSTKENNIDEKRKKK